MADVRSLTPSQTHFITAVYIVLAGGVVYRDARILFNDAIYDLLIGISYSGFIAAGETVPSVIDDVVDVTVDLTGVIVDVDVSLKDYLTDKDLGLWVLIEWVGCTWSLLMAVSSLSSISQHKLTPTPPSLPPLPSPDHLCGDVAALP